MTKPFLGGEPTEAQVKLIEEAWPSLTAGTLIKYESISAVIREDMSRTRFRTVTDAWRKKAMRAGIVIEAVPGLGFKVLDDKEKLDSSAGRFKSGRRKIGKAVQVVDAVRVEGLTTDHDKARALHQSRLMHATVEALAKTQKEIAVALRPVEALPRSVAWQGAAWPGGARQGR